MNILHVALFRSIFAHGSLSAAGRLMGMTPMAGSRALASLEAELGVRLFHRTTRTISLTAEGEAFLPKAVSLLDAHEAAVNSVAHVEDVAGVLKLTAPNVIGHSVVVPILAKLIADNPGLSVDLTLTDGVIDIITAGLDMAIRVSPLESSDMIATRLARNPRVVCASPDYIAKFGKPSTTSELGSHPCIRLHNMGSWIFREAGILRTVAVSGPFSASTVDGVRSACIEGLGLAMMTYWDVRHAIEAGHLECLEFADVEPDELGIWAVFPTKKHIPRRVDALIKELRTYFSAIEK